MDFKVKFKIEQIKDIGNFLNQCISKKNQNFDYLVYYNLKTLIQRMMLKVSNIYWKAPKHKKFSFRITPNEYESMIVVINNIDRINEYTHNNLLMLCLQVNEQKQSIKQMQMFN